jgi:hypothetical protein
MSDTRSMRSARTVELVARDLNNLPRLFAMFLSAGRRLTQRDIGAFRHWALQIEERRYELSIISGYVLWTSNEFRGSEACQWTVCAQGSTDRFDGEIHDCGK